MTAKETYDPQAVESKWQAAWVAQRSFAAKDPTTHPELKNFYALEMFPYPSGQLHMGHVRNYSIGDVVARYHRMLGENVMHPIGWDAFGLPAENAAIKHKVHPETWTRKNIAVMRDQLKALGISYDWEREFATCDVDYYRWNQWFFIEMFKKGLVYRKKAAVNWCPSCKTVLANEQVSAQGLCWRCDSHVETKELDQWYIKITQYAQALLDDHAELKGKWPEQVLTMQSHWIGRSEGAEVLFTVPASGDTLTVFTTRPDTLFGATYLAIAAEHPLAARLASTDGKESALAPLVAKARARKRDRQENPDKNGFFTGAYAINPINQKQIPIWVADYVLMDYGTGAIMAVPAHDQRDYEFAKKYDIPIIQVIQPASADQAKLSEKSYEGDGVLINSGEFDGLPSEQSKRKVGEWLAAQSSGKPTVTFKLRDWLVSRQRYWGTPIPMLYCAKCGIVPVPEKDLPVVLPTDIEFTGAGDSPLAQSRSFVTAPCPTCGEPSRRETDTMDTFVDSSWYYSRYTDPRNKTAPFAKEIAARWLPVNQYIGGIEHACMHLIYSRFWHKAMRDFGLVTCKEPFERLLAQGMVTLGGSAMSKSRGNVVDPAAIIEKFGADTARLFILFAAPPEKQLDWSDTGVEGAWRFLNRVWRLVENGVAQKQKGIAEAPEEDRKVVLRKQHWAIEKVTRDFGKEIQINTAISAVMELVNVLYVYPALGDATSYAATCTVVQLLSPIAPHLMEELWETLGQKGLASGSSWPKAEARWLVAESIEIAIQINGKLRSRVTLAPGSSREIMEQAALTDAKIMKDLEGKKTAKVIVVPNKLVNIVAN